MQAVSDSIESNKGLEESFYEECEYLLDDFYIPKIEELFKKYNVSIFADSRLYEMAEAAFQYHIEALDSYGDEISSSILIDDLQSFIDITGFVPEWEKYKDNIQNRYKNNLYSGHLSDIGVFASYTGVEPDWDGELRQMVNEAFETEVRSFEYHDVKNIHSLQELSGIAPDWEGELKTVMIEKYNEWIVGNDFYNIVRLQELSGIAPDWEGELKPAVIEGYKKFIAHDCWDDFVKLQELSGIAPDWEGELKPDVIKRYKEYIASGYWDSFVKLQELSGIAPDWEGELKPAVMEGYKKSIARYDLLDFVILQERSGITPDWEGELKPAVMEKYKITVSDAYFGYLEHIIKLQEFSGIAPDWEGELKPAVIEGYKKFIAHGYWDDFVKLQELSGIAPDWEGELKPAVMEKYGKYVKDGDYGYFNNIIKLQKMSGIEPDWRGELKRVVMERYGKFVKDGCLDYITKLQELSGIAPDWEGELKPAVMEKYGKYVKDGDYGYLNNIIELQKMSGILPDWQGDLKQVVMERYGRFMRDDGYLDSIIKLQKITGIKPDWQGELKPVVMVRYGKFVKDGASGYLNNIIKLQKMSGIEPDWQGELKPVVMERYGGYVKDCCLDYIIKLQEFSGIAPDWEGELKPAVIEGYKKFIAHDYWDDFVKLQELSGIAPDWEGELKPAVIKRYKEYIARNDLLDFVKLQELSGIAPDWDGELRVVVLEKYRYFIGNGNFNAISEMEDLSGLRIDWQDKSFKTAVRDFYHKALASSSLETTQRVLYGIEKTGIDIKEEKVWRALINDYVFGNANFKVDVLRVALGEKYDGVEELIRKSVSEVIKGLGDNFSGPGFEYLRINQASSFSKMGYLFDEFGVRPSDEAVRLLAYAGLSSDGNLSLHAAEYLNKIQVETELRCEELNHIAQQNFDPSHLAFILINYMPKRKDKKAKVNEAIEQIPAFNMVQEMLKIRGLAARKEYCPWRNGFDSLYKQVKKEQGDWSDKALYDGLLEYVRRFGMVNLPVMSSIVVDLTSNKFDENKELRFETAQRLKYFWQAHGIDRKVEDLDNPEFIDAVLNELNEAASEMREIILNDEIPEGLEHSDIDMEIFNILIPKVGSYGKLDDRSELIAKWRATVLRGDVEVTTPEYLRYEEVKYADVSSWGQSLSLETGVKEEDEGSRGLIKDIEAKKLSSLEHNPLEEMLLPLHEVMHDIKEMDDKVLNPDLFFGGLINDLRHDQRKTLDQLNETDKSQSKKIVGLKKKLEKIETLLQKLQILIADKGVTGFLSEQASVLEDQNKEKSEYLRSLVLRLESGKTDNYLQMQAMLEVLIGLFGQDALKEARKQLYIGIAYLMKLESGGHYDSVMGALVDSKKGVLKEEQVNAWVSWYKDELLEHFLNSMQAHDIRHVPFSADLLKLAEKVLYTTNIKDEMAVLLNEGGKDHKHPLVATWSKLRVYNENIKKIKEGVLPADLESKEKVYFYPAHGLTRIFGGDIASACYDKQRYDLAEGKKPRINTINLVGESDGKLEILGNCLLIETTNKNNERVLVTRAFNPSEKAIQRRLDPKDLLRKMIDFVIEAANKGGFDAVNVCVGDHSGADGTNRRVLFEIMQKEAVFKKWEIATELTNEPETNFNNYSTWNTETNKVYRVWQREK